MSDLSVSLEALARSRTQLPVSSYFDDRLFQRERARLFDPGPRYVGHALSVPEVGDFQTLRQEGDGRVLMHTPAGLRLMSNVCRHRQAVMLRGRGQTRSHITCPLHRWTYDLQGQLVGAPHFEQDPCLSLRQWPTRQWNGLVFEDNGHDVAVALAELGPRAALDFKGFVFDHAEVHECAYNWKTFIEVFLEDYHVGPFHPGLGGFVACDDLHWEFGAQHSVQTVGVNRQLEQPGSTVYQRWHQAVLRQGAGQMPPHGAIWLTYFPHLMVEWYPHVLVVSSLHPRGPQSTLNLIEFFYPEEIAAFEREFVQAEQAAYRETCAEDDEIALRMDAGRLALMRRGDDDAGPYQSPMEDGMQHFHEWYRKAMQDNAAA